ncbi:MAG: extracellular solute-binding protein [Clostridia bacterium]|nr:extracellular solute-binding protein [Clostridia bacterium]
MKKACLCVVLAGLLLAGFASGEAVNGTYVSERVTGNYTRVSAGYTLSAYAGEDIAVPVDGAALNYGDSMTVTADVPEDGLYSLRFDYRSTDASVLPLKIGFTVDGTYPFYECRNLNFETTWMQNPEPAYDRYGDEMVTVPEKADRWETKYLADATYRRTEPLLLELKAGTHEFGVTVKEGSFLPGGLTLAAPESVPEHTACPAAEGDALIILQGEDFTCSNDSSVHAVMEYDTAVDPYLVGDTVLNTIDSDSFDTAGQSVTWTFTAEKEGDYAIALNYRQSDKTDFPVFTDVMVDGRVPDSAFEAYPMRYGAGYQTRTLEDDAGVPLSVHLTAGEHTLTLRITVAPIREVMETLDEVMYGINDLSLEITKVAGTNADKYRDLSLSRYIPGIGDELNGYAERLLETERHYARYTNTGSGNVAVMSGMVIAAKQLQSLAENVDEIPYRVAELSSGSNSANRYLANTIDNMLGNALAIDRVYVYQTGAKLPEAPGALQGAGMDIGRFAGSFTDRSWSVSGTDPAHLQVWVNRSNQYVQIMQKMIDEYFTPETGIEVDLSVMPDQYKLVLANSAGNAPDVATGINYTIPYELAIRGALKDMTEFEDFRETADHYGTGFFLTGTVGNGIYSMPETLNFWVLFYRTDIMEKLGLKVPETMRDVTDMLPELQMRGLNFYYAPAGMLSMRNFHGTTPILRQNGGDLYYETAAQGTALGSRESVKGFTALTDLFTIYNIPKSVDNFYQHFRNGDLPIGVADFYTYNLIKNAAPELDGSWSIALIPGTEQEDGSIDRTSCGCAESTVIFKKDEEREKMAWEFIRWWSSTDVQAEFGQTMQVIYGDEYIWPTANLEALKRLPWDTADKNVVLEFARSVVDVARVPGTYLLEREMSNAFNDIVVNGANEQTRIDKAVKTINREIRRKLEEFGFIGADGSVIEEYYIPTIESVDKILGR